MIVSVCACLCSSGHGSYFLNKALPCLCVATLYCVANANVEGSSIFFPFIS